MDVSLFGNGCLHCKRKPEPEFERGWRICGSVIWEITILLAVGCGNCAFSPDQDIASTSRGRVLGSLCCLRGAIKAHSSAIFVRQGAIWMTGGSGIEMKNKQNLEPSSDYREDLLGDFRTDPGEAVEYIKAALEEGHGAFLVALKDVVDAKLGMTGLSRETELHRVALHRILSKNGNPTLATLEKVLTAVGLRLTVHAKPQYGKRNPHYSLTSANVQRYAPEGSGVYALYDGNRRVVYYGFSTQSVRDRLRKHLGEAGSFRAEDSDNSEREHLERIESYQRRYGKLPTKNTNVA